MPATRLTFLCHGATSATRRAAFPAPGDPLDARTLQTPDAGRLGRQDRCWTSPASGAAATAAALGLPCVVEPLLRDCDYGRWTGRTLADVERVEPDALASWFADPEARPHGGESIAAVVSRVGAWLTATATTPGRVLAVTHPMVIRAAAVWALGVPIAALWRLDVAPLSLTRITAQGGTWRLAGLNERP